MNARRLAGMVLVLATSGCHSLLSGPDAGSKGKVDMGFFIPGPEMGNGDLASVDAAPGDMACTPQYTSCAGLCGPVTDNCTNTTLECGGCSATQVCNLATHVCEVPKSTCSDLNATCGNVRNSCGTRLFCGDCTDPTQMCDNDTNQCAACTVDTSTPEATLASCQKLGYQCGQAWLGCGPRNNLTNCGNCPTGQTCNLIFNVCEPTCMPPDKATACANANTTRGIQCGVIDDGCGGAIDCGGCGAGLACGAQGDPGLCEPFESHDECVALGHNCGTINSLCGGTIDCGSCTSPQVCNPNGVCGAPCTPLTCGALATPPQCGTVPDNCGGNLGCGNCPDNINYTCIKNVCCKKKSCSTDYANMCGTGLDDGCGGTLNCTCASGSCSATATGVTGTCCVNTNTCPANACGISVTNSCTGVVTQCSCNPSTQWCDTSTSPGQCKPLETCKQLVGDQPGKQGDMCSNGPAFNAGGGNYIECPCGSGGLCLPTNMPPPTTSPPVTGTTVGVCCFNTATCSGKCNGTVITNTCTGAQTTCNSCNGFCNSMNQCQAFKTCGSYGANGGNGQPCGTGFDNGNGGTINCPCTGGRECSSGGVIVTNGMGTCCTPPTCNGQCNVTLTDPCGGPPVQCPSTVCGNGFFCNGSNMCQPLDTCANYQSKNPPGAPGDKCGTFSNGNGGTINCPCDTSSPYSSSNVCNSGTCSCTATACTKCTDNGSSNGCGAALSCVCPDGANTHNTICDPSGTPANVDGFGCCYPYSTSHLPPGWPAVGPGNVPICTPPTSDGCGGSFSIPCPSTNPNGNSPSDKTWPNVKCVIQSGGYGLCLCTADSCPNNDTNNDGCGDVPMCHS